MAFVLEANAVKVMHERSRVIGFREANAVICGNCSAKWKNNVYAYAY